MILFIKKFFISILEAGEITHGLRAHIDLAYKSLVIYWPQKGFNFIQESPLGHV